MTTAPLPNRKIVEESRMEKSMKPSSSTNSGKGVSSKIGSKPTLFEVVQPMRFLIMDAPREGNLHLYIKEMRKNSVTDIVRVCEPTYSAGELTSAGITLHDMEYKDGTSPPEDLIDKFLKLVESTFIKNPSPASERNCIAVHCVAGLGRAPVMVAIACIEFAKMDPMEVVVLLRQYRRGAINDKQLLYLEQYKPYYRRSGESACCVIF